MSAGASVKLPLHVAMWILELRGVEGRKITYDMLPELPGPAGGAVVPGGTRRE